jgi:hypothetical protein
MKLHSSPKGFCYLLIFGVLTMSAGLAWGHSDQKATAQQLSALRSQFPNASKQPAFCTNCARLSAHISSMPGYGCLNCDMLQPLFGASGFFDPGFYIKNNGSLASNPGTLTAQWYDLAAKANITRTVAVPAIPAGADNYVTIPDQGILFLISEGVRITIDYSDAVAARHMSRKVTKCPDN